VPIERPQRVLLTGATGFVGSHLLKALASSGTEVHCIARADGADTAARRVQAAHDQVDAAPSQKACRWHVHEGDLAAFDVGELTRTLASFGGFDAIWHCAASTDLAGTDPARLQRDNVDATESVLRLALSLEVARFHHISTAYQCGVTERTVPETRIARPARFRSAYEATKWAAEDLLWNAIPELLTVYRPSIVLGPADPRRITRWQGFYMYVRHAGRMAAALARDSVAGAKPLLIPGRSHTPLDLVLVDEVVAAMLAIGSRPGSLGRAFHLVARKRWSIEELSHEIGLLLGGGEIRLSTSEEVEASWRHDRIIGGLAPYLRSSPEFDTTHTRAALEASACVSTGMTRDRVVRHLRLALGREVRPAQPYALGGA